MVGGGRSGVRVVVLSNEDRSELVRMGDGVAGTNVHSLVCDRAMAIYVSQRHWFTVRAQRVSTVN